MVPRSRGSAAAPREELGVSSLDLPGGGLPPVSMQLHPRGRAGLVEAELQLSVQITEPFELGRRRQFPLSTFGDGLLR